MSIIQVPLRLVSGAYLLNSGLGKAKIDEEAAEQLRDMGAAGVPYLKDLSPKQFKQLLVATEVGLGGALLLPFVPGWLAGGALTAFSASLMNMYRNIPEMTLEDGIRPSEQGVPIAKDAWLVGIGVALVGDSLVNRSGKKNKAAAQRAKKISSAKDDKVEAIQSATQDKVEAINKARDEQTHALRSVRQDLKNLRKKN